MTSKKLFFVFLALLLFAGAAIYQKSFRDLRCANTLSCKESLELSVNNGENAIFNGEVIEAPFITASDFEESRVLGMETGTGEKRIDVDLTTQTLRAYQGNELYLETPVSTGKWYPTPTGEFKIWSKFRATKMSGGSGADYYYLPNVPYVMFYSGSGVAAGRGFSLHGAYWHNNFGHAMSHGCVNMRTIDAKKIYYWADSDTVIHVYGKAV